MAIMKNLKSACSRAWQRVNPSSLPPLTLTDDDIAALVQHVRFENPLDFSKDGYRDAGIAIERIAYAIDDHYESDIYKRANPAYGLTEPLRELGMLIAMQIYKSPENRKIEVPGAFINRIIKHRPLLEEMLDIKMNCVMVDLDSDVMDSVKQLAGFSRGLSALVKKHELKAFEHPDLNGHEEQVFSFLNQKSFRRVSFADQAGVKRVLAR